MMKLNAILFAVFVLFMSLFSCQETGDDHGSSNSHEQETDQVKPKVIVITNYQLNTDLSKIKWTRALDQKSMKRTMKIFGADVDVEMDAVTLNMNGDVDPINGKLVVIDGLYDHADVKFDMNTFKFAAEKGKGLFDVKSYPISPLVFLSFEEKDLGKYLAKCELTIQDHTEKIEFPVSVILKRKDISVKGSFEFNTLSFPLRSPDQEAEINKDVILVQFDLNYLQKD